MTAMVARAAATTASSIRLAPLRMMGIVRPVPHPSRFRDCFGRWVLESHDREVLGRVLPSPFFASFVGRAREGDLRDVDPSRRSAAWAHWAVRSTRMFSGSQDRVYAGVLLPGRFHDPLRTGPELLPHLEVSEARLRQPDPSFPDRLAQVGNGLLFPWWVYPEVTAVRRALLQASGSGDVARLSEALWRIRPGMSDMLSGLAAGFASQWPKVEHALVADLPRVAPLVVSGFSGEEVARVAPSLAPLGVSVGFEPGLLARSGERAARRVGVWSVSAVVDGEACSLGVVTPRLTANSLFRDRMFDVSCEAPAALLVRLLLMRRLAEGLAGMRVEGEVGEEPRPGREPFLRAVVATAGSKLPEASPAAAVHMLQAFPDAEAAWGLLEAWAVDGGMVLTVSRASFLVAHANALRFVRRAEEPVRGDINVVLPLAWDSSGRVVRATFVRPQGG